MAALALPQARGMFAAFRLPFLRPTLMATILPGFLAAPKATNWAIPTLESLLELLPPWVLAVPKKKTSHSRKAMRSANKGLKDKQNLVHCPGFVVGRQRQEKKEVMRFPAREDCERFLGLLLPAPPIQNMELP
ncbi:hypothetical protein NLI96_g11686 [Meripilus lineatus]|uniref:Uncharacterized protein n=1 Tax=Meripilus lineatus TaxID=2056292 RepID=A0AAD5URG8_9APHY|nr:hypothetical protein NLI96_g11686 [Physisporinus lineatus]